MESYKTCTNVTHVGEKLLPIYNFSKRSIIKNTYKSHCKLCCNLKSIIYRKSEIGRVKTNLSTKNYREKRRCFKGMAWVLWNSARRNAKSRGIDFSLKPQDIFIPDLCPVLGINLIKSTDYLRKNNISSQLCVPNYPSIDRLDSNKGYHKENITIISWRANHIKTNSSLQELKKVYNWWTERINNSIQ